MGERRRDEVKYVRDAVKKHYKRASSCRICGSTEKLQFHHYHSMAELWHRWVLKNNPDISDINNIRYDFIDEHFDLLVNQTVTLCSECHNNRLHKIYGKSPAVATAKKQQRWVEIQRSKNGLD